VDLATLQSNVAGALGLDFDSTAPSNGDGPRLLGWANDAVIDMLKQTHCYISPAILTMTAGAGDYRLDAAILAIDDIYMTSSGTNFRVKRLATTDLLNLRLFSVATSPVQMYALNGDDMLMVYPAPIQADTMTIYYVPKPTPLANPTDDPSSSTLGGISTQYHYGLELYMMWKAGDAFDDEGSQNGETYRRMYLGDPNTPPGTEQRDGFIGKMKKDVRKKGGKHLAGVLIPPRSRRIYVPNPGIDTGSAY
jgi:hypothetical protein